MAVTLLMRTIVILAALLSQASLAAEEVGTVAFSRGVLTGQVDGEPPRLIGKGVPLHNGETLNTGSRAFALITLDDGSKMTLRPNTTIKIENIDTGALIGNACFQPPFIANDAQYAIKRRFAFADDFTRRNSFQTGPRPPEFPVDIDIGQAVFF